MSVRTLDTTGRVWLFDTPETPVREVHLLLQHIAGAGGLARHTVADRLVSVGPEGTQLLDRLEKQGGVSSTRASRATGVQ